MREMPDGIEQYALISPYKVSLKTFGQTRWITGVGVEIASTSWSFRCKGSYLESQASPSHQRERYAFRVMRDQSGLEKLSAACANSIALNQPGGLQVSHWMRANSTGFA